MTIRRDDARATMAWERLGVPEARLSGTGVRRELAEGGGLEPRGRATPLPPMPASHASGNEVRRSTGSFPSSVGRSHGIRADATSGDYQDHTSHDRTREAS